MGIDDLLKQIEEDELADRVQVQTHISPIEYARARGMAPQKVYRAIRQGYLSKQLCQCGRPVILIAAADEHFGFTEEEDDDER